MEAKKKTIEQLVQEHGTKEDLEIEEKLCKALIKPFITTEVRNKIIKRSCKKLATTMMEKLYLFEIPTSIHVEGSHGTMIEFVIETKKHEK